MHKNSTLNSQHSTLFHDSQHSTLFHDSQHSTLFHDYRASWIRCALSGIRWNMRDIIAGICTGALLVIVPIMMAIR